MQLILLSGGSGQRLWPLSNNSRSKQFIDVLTNDDGEMESMVQRVFRQIKSVDPKANVTIATSKSQVSAIRSKLGSHVDLSIEPCRRDTFAAIALAASYLHDVKHIPSTEPIVVCPVDPFVEDEYFVALSELSNIARSGEANLNLLGIEPTYPSEKYGYIIPTTRSRVSKVSTFKEKPSEEIAKEYIKEGALWNGGIFAFKLEYLLKIEHERLGSSSYQWIFDHYSQLPKISFDYAVVEKESKINVIRYHGEWRDLGTWSTLTDTMDRKQVGKSIVDDTCEDVNVINELDIPILTLGIKHAVISASPQGILVSDKIASAKIKPLVEQLNDDVMFADKSWGRFCIINEDSDSITAKLTLKSKHHFQYQTHQYRTEIWTIVSGCGTAIIDGKLVPVQSGSVVEIHNNVKHSMVAEDEMKILEVQIGGKISKDDKVKLNFDFKQFDDHE